MGAEVRGSCAGPIRDDVDAFRRSGRRRRELDEAVTATEPSVEQRSTCKSRCRVQQPPADGATADDCHTDGGTSAAAARWRESSSDRGGARGSAGAKRETQRRGRREKRRGRTAGKR